MENNFKIAIMSFEDLNSIKDILETDFDDFWNYNILKKELEDQNSIYIVCKNNNEIVALAGITIILDTAELNYIVVKKSYRGNGISRGISGKQLNEKALNEEFMKVFELINDDFFHVQPKLIPIIPGDDPSVMNKPTDHR